MAPARGYAALDAHVLLSLLGVHLGASQEEALHPEARGSRFPLAPSGSRFLSFFSLLGCFFGFGGSFHLTH